MLHFIFLHHFTFVKCCACLLHLDSVQIPSPDLSIAKTYFQPHFALKHAFSSYISLCIYILCLLMCIYIFNCYDCPAGLTSATTHAHFPPMIYLLIYVFWSIQRGDVPLVWEQLQHLQQRGGPVPHGQQDPRVHHRPALRSALHVSLSESIHHYCNQAFYFPISSVTAYFDSDVI